MNPATSLVNRRNIALVIAVIGYLVPWFLEIPGLSEAGHRLLSIFLLAVILWVSEAIPLFATSSLVILMLVLTMSNASEDLMWGMADGFTAGSAPAFAVYFATLSDPVLILFLGGFFLANGAAKFGLDKNLAALMLKPFGTKPTRVLLGIMLITGFLSMWMSNTATTATLMAVVLPLIHRLEKGDKLRVALALGVPFAANIGGMGTPVGSPPNAISIAALGEAGSVTFSQWMVFAVPLTIVLLFMTWLVLVFCFRTKTVSIDFSMKSAWVKSRPAWIYYITAIITIGLWVTESLHGINSFIVGLIPVTVLLSTGVINTKEFRSMEWDVLWLVAGGIALGRGVGVSGFDSWVVGLIDWQDIPPMFIGGVLALAALLLSTFISNSAAANLLAPMAVAIATSTDSGPVATVAYVAMACSLAMSMPISTPPNAIAYASGAIRTGDMAKGGLIIGFVGIGVLYLLLPHLVRLAGLQ
ncbi:MAG: SLC13 family permease [Luteolibacter sp.]|jgi:solute carrier family 13 (sodium-dependent dicarboxylate transporter), member 2/3/5